MNCRRINSLLSAYLDSELTGTEMLAIRDHLRDCSSCEQEYESLKETKRLIASLAFRAPRAELEALLLQEAERAETPFSVGRAASRLLTWLGSGNGTPAPSYLRPIAATALLTLAGLWLASVSLETPSGDTENALAGSVVTFDPPTAVLPSSSVGVAAVPVTVLPVPAVAVAGLPVTSSGNSPYAQASMSVGSSSGLGMISVGTVAPGMISTPGTGPSVALPTASGSEWGSLGGVNPTLILMARRYVLGR